MPIAGGQGCFGGGWQGAGGKRGLAFNAPDLARPLPRA